MTDDLKKLSVQRLRELARTHLGKGHSRFRTKAELLAALKEVLRAPLSKLREAAGAALSSEKRIRVVDFPPGRPARVRQPPPRSAEETAKNVPRSAAKAVPVKPTKRASKPARTTAGKDRPGAAAPSLVQPAPERAERVEEPVGEGFFEVPNIPRRARVVPRPPEPVEAWPVPARDSGTDAPVLLVRDPTTLFAFWDFRRELERGAALGLREPLTLLRLYQGDTLVRSLELPLHSRSTYVAGLHGGEEYTAEVAFLGRDGWTRPVGRRSAPRRLPPGRPSERLEVRTLRLPWSASLEEVPRPSAPQPPRLEPLDSPRRVDLPSSPAGRGRPPSGSSGPRSGRN